MTFSRKGERERFEKFFATDEFLFKQVMGKITFLLKFYLQMKSRGGGCFVLHFVNLFYDKITKSGSFWKFFTVSRFWELNLSFGIEKDLIVKWRRRLRLFFINITSKLCFFCCLIITVKIYRIFNDFRLFFQLQRLFSSYFVKFNDFSRLFFVQIW